MTQDQLRTPNIDVPARLEKRVVAFVDILGFREIMRHAEVDNDTFQTLRTVLQFVQDYRGKPWELNEAHDAPVSSETDRSQMTAFSDCYLISDEVGFEFSVVFKVQRLCFHLLSKGILSRGGITSGSLYHNGPIVLGQGMIDAYELEHTAAVYPRVLVADDLARQVRDSEVQRQAIVRKSIGIEAPTMVDRDVDGCWFVQPFLAIDRTRWNGGRDPKPDEPFMRVRAQLVNRLRYELKKGVAADISRVRWLVAQFNRAMERAPGNAPRIDLDHPAF